MEGSLTCKNPLIWPVSYPKQIPPIETKMAIKKVRTVRNGTFESSLNSAFLGSAGVF